MSLVELAEQARSVEHALAAAAQETAAQTRARRFNIAEDELAKRLADWLGVTVDRSDIDEVKVLHSYDSGSTDFVGVDVEGFVFVISYPDTLNGPPYYFHISLRVVPHCPDGHLVGYESLNGTIYEGPSQEAIGTVIKRVQDKNMALREHCPKCGEDTSQQQAIEELSRILEYTSVDTLRKVVLGRARRAHQNDVDQWVRDIHAVAGL